MSDTRRCLTCGKCRPLERYESPAGRRCLDCWNRIRQAAVCRYCGCPSGLDARRQPRKVCLAPECREQAHRDRDRVRDAALARMAASPTKRCPACGETKPRTTEHFPPKGYRPDGTVIPDSYCRPCKRADDRLRYHDAPERQAARRRVWAQTARDRVHRREKPEVFVGPELPSAPMVATLVRLAEQEGGGDGAVELVCERAGITSRSLRRWRTGESPAIRDSVVDQILTRLDLLWWEVYTPEYPDAYQRAAEVWEGSLAA